MSFKDFGLNEMVVRGVESMGYVDPTPIQLRAFPIILSGRDMMGSAQTGTGKTAAFVLPGETNESPGPHAFLRSLLDRVGTVYDLCFMF